MRRSAEELAVLSRLLDAVLDIPVPQRGAWIDSLEPADEGFKPALRQMLAQAQTSDDPFTPIGGSMDAAILQAAESADSPQPEAGGRVGPYDLIRELGRGGMGSVWLARRIEGLTRREVALKLPHPGLFHAELAQRIARERDILEGLAHPNIARLYEAGVTALGQPFLAIEYVEGRPIDVYCQERRLGTRARIELFERVLDAMQYAHSKLVLHRDLKPANILVTDAGQPMILDFGIAKLMHEPLPQDAALTRFGGRALTPDYASPEQIAGQTLGTSSDVYSLGVLLYELLAGSRPYELARNVSIEQAFAQIVVTRPSSRAVDAGARRALRGDLDTIVLKALKASPLERYPTVAALTEDLRRHLRGEPVLARPDTAWYRLHKFSQRNKLAVGAVGAVIAALGVGIALALSQTHKARLEAARAEQVKGFALSMLDSADSDAGAGATTTAVDLLQAARMRVKSELRGQPAVAVELMTAIAFGLLGQDRAQDAASLLQDAIRLSLQTAGPDDVRTIEAQVVYGEALYDLGKIDEAIAHLKPLPDRARRAGALHAQVDAWRNLSNAQLDAGDAEGALASVRAAVAAVPPVGAGTDRRLLLDAKQAHLSLANVLSNLRKPGVAGEARAALRYAEQLGNDPATLLEARTLLGIGLVRENHPQAGLRELQSAYADMRRIRGVDNRQTLVLASLLGTSCLDAGDVACARNAYQDSLDGTLRHADALGPFSVAWSHFGIAAGLAAANEDVPALAHVQEAIKLFEGSSGPEAPMTMRSRSLHALLLARSGRLADAEHEFLANAAAKRTNDETAVLQLRLSMLRRLQGRHDEAIELARQGVAKAQSSTSTVLQARSHAALGVALLAANRFAEAQEPLRRAVASFSASQVPQSPERLEAEAALRAAAQAKAPPAPRRGARLRYIRPAAALQFAACGPG